MNVTLRAMVPEDVDVVLQLAASAAEAPQWHRRDYENILVEAPADPVARYALVAQQAETVAGFAAVRWLRGETTAEIESLVVEPKYRRRGIGGSLVTACMEWAAHQGATALRLEVRASNGVALALYRRLGFASVGRRKAYYAVPVEDALLLEAPLVPLSPL
jgi:ribosomal-protein-alanine acetyltransferase